MHKNYVIEQRDGKWCLLSHDGSKVLGCHDSEEKAKEQEKAVQAAKNNELLAHTVLALHEAMPAELQMPTHRMFLELLQEREAREELNELIWSLQDSISSIYSDQKLSAPDRISMVRETVGQFLQVVSERYPPKDGTGEYARVFAFITPFAAHGKKKDKEDEVESYRLDGVEVFATGKHNGDEYTEKDLDLIVQAYNEAGYHPPLKMGHDETPGKPAVGWLENVRREGKKLLADIADIPKAVYDAIKSRAYDRVSAEVYWNLNSNGRTFKRALKAVALLGADVPAVTSLKPLRELFSGCTGIIKHYDVDPFNKSAGGPNMDEELKKLREQLADLTAKYEAANKELTEQKTHSQKAGGDAATLKAQLETTQATLHKVTEERRQERISTKAGALKLPALRPHLTALYAMVTEGEARTVKFSVEAGKEQDMSAEAVLDALVTEINTKIEPIMAQYAQEDGERPKGDLGKLAQNAADEVHSRTVKYQQEKNEKDYMTALNAVLAADPALKARYTSAQQ